LNDALRGFQESLDLVPADDHETRGRGENQIGNVYRQAGHSYTGQALRRYQRAIQHHEARGDVYEAGLTRYNIALLLRGEGRTDEALHYARAAIDNFRNAGPDGAPMVAQAERLIADLERHDR
jgi:tetratricopeptide (TPR) repeat protein